MFVRHPASAHEAAMASNRAANDIPDECSFRKRGRVAALEYIPWIVVVIDVMLVPWPGNSLCNTDKLM
jgi:hypothetical protein